MGTDSTPAYRGAVKAQSCGQFSDIWVVIHCLVCLGEVVPLHPQAPMHGRPQPLGKRKLLIQKGKSDLSPKTALTYLLLLALNT